MRRSGKLFRLPKGVNGFLLLHFPLLLFILYGLVLVREASSAGLIFSFVLACGGIFAFSIHSWFISRGREEFTSVISRVILYVTLVLSLVQLGLTYTIWAGR